MSEVSAWNAVDASNNATPPDGWPEGMAASAVNDAARMMMGALRREHDLITAKIGSTAGAISTTTINATTITGSTINSTGNASVGGTLSVANGATITGNISVSGQVSCAGVQYPAMGLTAPATNIGFGYSFTNGSLWVQANGGSVGYLIPTPSDARLKQDIEPIQVDPLADLCRVELHSFNQLSARADPVDGMRHRDVGFIAQELREIIPDAVIEPPPEMAGGYLGLDLMPLVAYCVGAIQQLAERVARLEEERAHV